MRRLLKRVALGCLFGAVFLAIAYLGLSSRASNPAVVISKCGDGELLDKGFVSYYPRYVLEFPPVELVPDASQKYHFNCIPSADLLMWLVLDVTEEMDPLNDAESRKLLNKLGEAGTTVKYRVHLVENGSQGREIHRYDGVLGSNWRRASLGDLFFFVEKGRGVGLGSLPNQGELIGLDLTIQIAGGAIPPPVGLRFRPQLVGGGFIK